MAARLGELGISPVSTRAILEYADGKWGKFLGREDRADRLEQLLHKAEQVRPDSSLGRYVPVSLSQLKDSAPDIDWLIEGLLAKGTYGIITGGTGVGKSRLGLQLGMCLAKGVKWEYEMTKSRVLYGSHEMGPHELVNFTEKLSLGMPLSESEDIFHLIPIGSPISLLTQEGRDFYLQYLDEYDVFFFDTASSSTHLSMLDEATGLGLVSFFNLLTSEGKTVIVLGHDTKEGVRNNRAAAEDAYGHRLLIDRSSMVLRVSVFDPEHLILSYPKVRAAKRPEPKVYAINEQTLWLDYAPSIDLNFKPGKHTVKPSEEGGAIETFGTDAGIF